MVLKFLRKFSLFYLFIFLQVESSWDCGTWSLQEGKMRNLCIFLRFLQVTYTHSVLGDIDFKKSVRIWVILPKKYLGLVSERT